jgi:Rrf2 family protein
MYRSIIVSTTTTYALRAAVHLARLPEGQSILGRDLAESISVPANYLSKIMVTLRNAQLVETARGQGGGYRLAKPAEQIPLMQIAELFESDRLQPGCLLGEAHECCDELACTAHDGWRKVMESYLSFLSTTTVAELGDRHKLETL